MEKSRENEKPAPEWAAEGSIGGARTRAQKGVRTAHWRAKPAHKEG